MTNEYVRKEISGAVPATTLSSGITAGATSFVVASGTGWPTGVYPFVVALDRGNAAEEHVLCSSRSGNTLTVLNRGYDGTSAQSHAANVPVAHIIDGYTIDQVNRMANLLTAAGSLMGFNGTNLVAVPVGTNGDSLIVDSTQAAGVRYSKLAPALAASAPNASTTPLLLWYDQTHKTLRVSDLTNWLFSSAAFKYANTAARDTELGATPAQDGMLAIVGTTAYFSSGGVWVTLASAANVPTVTVSASAPGSPKAGDIWGTPV